MKVSITRIHLRSIWKVPSLALHRMKVKRKSKKAGALKVSSSGLGLRTYSMTLWPDEASFEAFVNGPVHAETLKESRLLAEEICVLAADADDLPSFEKAQELLDQEGKTIRY